MLSLERICNLLFLIRDQLRWSSEDIRPTVGAEVVMRHIFKATLQQQADDEWEQMQASSVQYSHIWWMAGQQTNHSNNDATIKTSVTIFTLSPLFLPHSHQSVYLLHLHLQSLYHPETGLTIICCCSDTGLHYLPRWSESAGIGPCGVHRIQLPSITHKYGPVKRLFPFKWWHEKQKPNFRSWAKQGSSATFMFTGPQWSRYLFGTISWLIKYLLPTMSNVVTQLLEDI